MMSRSNTFFSIFIVAIYTLPFILSPVAYQDDIGRTIWGYYDWESNGRPLATLSMQIINFFVNVFNLSPLYIIIGLIAYIYSFERSCTYIFNDNRIVISLSCLVAIASPFFLENLAYNFDSMTMLFSVSLAFLSAFSRKEGRSRVLFQSFLILAMLSLYQATINLYIILVVVSYIAGVNRNSNHAHLIKTHLESIASLAIAYVFYSLVIAKHFVKLEYNITHSQTTFNISDISQNIHSFIELIGPLLGGSSSRVIFIFTLSVILLSSVVSSFKVFKHKALTALTVVNVLILILAPILSLYFVIGSLAFLKFPVFSPRVLIGGVGYMFLFSYSAYNLTRHYNKAVLYFTLLTLPVLLFCFNLCYTYNYALKDQARLESSISDQISYRLFDAGFKPNADKLIIVGSEPRTIVSINAIMRIPYLEKVLPLYFYGNNPFGFIKLRQTYFLRDINITDKKTLDEGMSHFHGAKGISRTEYFSVLKFEDFYFIHFN